jgi:hypothetical protein
MNDSNIQWLQLIVAIISGGAMGALITALITSFRNRVQPIGYKIDVVSIFKETLGVSSLMTQINISDGQKDYKFNNLFIARVEIHNSANADYEQFDLGITLPEGSQAIYVQAAAEDRYRETEFTKQVSLEKPRNEIDLVLRPFNRKDLYSFDVFIVIDGATPELGNIKLHSRQSIQFKNYTGGRLTEDDYRVLAERFIKRSLRSFPF